MNTSKVIRDEAGYDRALAEIAPFFETGAEPQAGTAESERFDALAAMVEDYEAANWPIGTIPPVA